MFSPDKIVITEMLPKAPSTIINSSLFALPIFYAKILICSPLSTNICGVGIFVSDSSQIFMQSMAFMDRVWVNINLHGSDRLLIGDVYCSPSSHLSADSFCSLLTSLNNYVYTHLIIFEDFF